MTFRRGDYTQGCRLDWGDGTLIVFNPPPPPPKTTEMAVSGFFYMAGTSRV